MSTWLVRVRQPKRLTTAMLVDAEGAQVAKPRKCDVTISAETGECQLHKRVSWPKKAFSKPVKIAAIVFEQDPPGDVWLTVHVDSLAGPGDTFTIEPTEKAKNV